MRRISILLFLLFFLPISGSGQTIAGSVPTTDWVFGRTFALNSKEVVKGRVKSITEREYRAKEKFGEIVKDSKANDWTPTFYYDLKGKIKECKIVFDKRIKSSKWINEEWVQNEYFTSIFQTYLFSYNNSGILTEINEYYEDDNKLRYRTKFKHDLKGNPIEKNVYHSTGDLESKYGFKYDENNNLISVIHYNKYKNIEDVTYFTYNDKNLRITSKRYNADEKCFSSYIYTYNEKKQISKRVSPPSQYDPYELEKYTYDLNGNIITEIFFLEPFFFNREDVVNEEDIVNEVDSEEIYYDANGEVINHEDYRLNNFLKPELFFSSKDEFKYVYDSYGNWISRTSITNDKPEKIIERKIEYYK